MPSHCQLYLCCFVWRWRGDRADLGLVRITNVVSTGSRYDGILNFMTTTVSVKGEIVLPTEIREQDGIEPGQEFDIERIDRGEYRLVRRQPRANEGLVDWLLACPEKGFFASIESESRDVL